MRKFSKQPVSPSRKKVDTIARKRQLFGNNDFSVKTFHKRKKHTFFSEFKKNIALFNKQKNKKWYILAGSLALILTIWLFIAFGPVFRVKDIFVTRQGTVINIEQAYETLNNLRGKNIFFLDSRDISNRLKRSQNTIKSILITKRLPSTLNVNLESYAPKYASSEYIILENGVIIPRDTLDSSELPELTIHENMQNMYVFGNAFPPNDIANIDILTQGLAKNILGFDIQDILYYPVEKEVLIHGNLGSLFIFDLSGDIATQIKQLAIYHKEYADITQNPYIYIDARIREKLFICGYENEFDCRSSLSYIYGDDVFNFASAQDASKITPPNPQTDHPENTGGQPAEQ